MGGMTQSHGAGRRLREDDAESAAPAASAVVAALPAKPFELDRPEVRLNWIGRRFGPVAPAAHSFG